jgi:hypothetical protein
MGRGVTGAWNFFQRPGDNGKLKFHQTQFLLIKRAGLQVAGIVGK